MRIKALDSGERAPQDIGEVLVERLPCHAGQVVALPEPGAGVRRLADPLGESEGPGEPFAPRLEVRVAKPGEPRVARRDAEPPLERAERDDQRRERMPDRAIAPIEDTWHAA